MTNPEQPMEGRLQVELKQFQEKRDRVRAELEAKYGEGISDPARLQELASVEELENYQKSIDAFEEALGKLTQ